MTERRREIYRETSAEVVAAAREILAAARSGALATIGVEDGAPQASRVGVAMLAPFTPLILVSALAAHTAALRADPRCSLLVGEIGKGDPLAHPRVTLKAVAREIGRTDGAYAAARACYLAVQPKAELYVELPDFAFMALTPRSASFVAGFGRAYLIEAEALTG